VNSQEVLQLIQQGESETLEFKRSLGEIREIVETAGAFANAFGGTILIGISGQKEIVGVQIGTDTLESLANTIKQNTDPAVLLSISTLGATSSLEDNPMTLLWRNYGTIGLIGGGGSNES